MTTTIIHVVSSRYKSTTIRKAIMDFFSKYWEFDYSIRYVAEAIGRPYNTTKYHVKALTAEGKLIQTRSVGKGQMYQLPYWSVYKSYRKAK